MPPTRVFHTYTRLPIFSTAALLWLNYDLYRVVSGTHPYFSPRLEKAGLTQKDTDERRQYTKTDANTSSTRTNQAAKKEEAGWTYLNGVPIPSFDMLMRPFRRE